MDMYWASLAGIFQWVLRASMYGAVIVVVVMAVQRRWGGENCRRAGVTRYGRCCYLTMVGIILGTFFGFRRGIQSGLVILAIDCLVLVPVLMSRDYFFSGERNTHILSPPLNQRDG